MSDIALDLALLSVGILIGTVVNRWYSRKASDELKTAAEGLSAESQQLRRMVNTLSRAFEEARLIEVTRDEAGELLGVSFRRDLSGDLTLSGGVTTARTANVAVGGSIAPTGTVTLTKIPGARPPEPDSNAPSEQG